MTSRDARCVKKSPGEKKNARYSRAHTRTHTHAPPDSQCGGYEKYEISFSRSCGGLNGPLTPARACMCIVGGSLGAPLSVRFSLGLSRLAKESREHRTLAIVHAEQVPSERLTRVPLMRPFRWRFFTKTPFARVPRPIFSPIKINHAWVQLGVFFSVSRRRHQLRCAYNAPSAFSRRFSHRHRELLAILSPVHFFPRPVLSSQFPETCVSGGAGDLFSVGCDD